MSDSLPPFGLQPSSVPGLFRQNYCSGLLPKGSKLKSHDLESNWEAQKGSMTDCDVINDKKTKCRIVKGLSKTGGSPGPRVALWPPLLSFTRCAQSHQSPGFLEQTGAPARAFPPTPPHAATRLHHPLSPCALQLRCPLSRQVSSEDLIQVLPLPLLKLKSHHFNMKIQILSFPAQS